jgi:hypothetical protein
MRPMTPDELIEKIDGPLFRRQRRLLDDLLAAAAVPTDIRLTPEQVSLLEGLQGLLDNLADIAHDRYGADCLLIPN